MEESNWKRRMGREEFEERKGRRGEEGDERKGREEMEERKGKRG